MGWHIYWLVALGKSRVALECSAMSASVMPIGRASMVLRNYGRSVTVDASTKKITCIYAHGEYQGSDVQASARHGFLLSTGTCSGRCQRNWEAIGRQALIFLSVAAPTRLYP